MTRACSLSLMTACQEFTKVERSHVIFLFEWLNGDSKRSDAPVLMDWEARLPNTKSQDAHSLCLENSNNRAASRVGHLMRCASPTSAELPQNLRAPNRSVTQYSMAARTLRIGTTTIFIHSTNSIY
jgi:hypothetical protein